MHITLLLFATASKRLVQWKKRLLYWSGRYSSNPFDF